MLSQRYALEYLLHNYSLFLTGFQQHMKDIGRWARIHRENRIQKDAEATARRQSECV